MDIVKEYEFDEIKCALGLMSKVTFILKWNGDKHKQLIKSPEFIPNRTIEELNEHQKRMKNIKSLSKIDKKELFEKIEKKFAG